jgi:hypothetical protein
MSRTLRNFDIRNFTRKCILVGNVWVTTFFTFFDTYAAMWSGRRSLTEYPLHHMPQIQHHKHGLPYPHSSLWISQAERSCPTRCRYSKALKYATEPRLIKIVLLKVAYHLFTINRRHFRLHQGIVAWRAASMSFTLCFMQNKTTLNHLNLAKQSGKVLLTKIRNPKELVT